ncbi:MAG: hypothetical protein M1813_008799 [Trichoglossum hirsutum]|jgi:hypothetical protein|nr:MAG: hypothetical protein M1813_008799 [Trichoglossum hirsutum]
MASIIHFYDPTVRAKDYRGRTLDYILSWPDSQLEAYHDYIQILFPLPESSPFNDGAPVINRTTFEAFRSRPELRARLKESFLRILKFFGFELANVSDAKGFRVSPAPNFISASRRWFRPFDHNHLRITRVIRCLRVLGLEDEAVAFFRGLEALVDDHKRRLSRSSLTYWQRAALRPLYVVPQDREADERVGLKFLVEFEKAKQR